MNLGTMRQEILEDTHSQVSTNAITRKIIASIRHHRANRLWFSDRSFRFNLVSGQSEYAPDDASGLPSDLVEIVGNRIWVSLDGNDTQRYPIYRKGSDTVEEIRSIDTTPDHPFAWDFWGGALRIVPTPDDSDHVLDGRYVRNIGEPLAEYAGGAWVFKTPDASALLDAAYTSDWFEDGYSLVRHYAVYLLFAEVLRDPTEAGAALQRWAEAKMVLDEESEGKTAGGLEIQGHLL